MSRTIGGHEVRRCRQDLELKQRRTVLTGETGEADTDPAKSE